MYVGVVLVQDVGGCLKVLMKCGLFEGSQVWQVVECLRWQGQVVGWLRCVVIMLVVRCLVV